MNKRIIVLLALLVITVFVGCSGSVNADNSIPAVQIEAYKFDMDFVESDMINWVGYFYLYEDTETTIEYIVFYNNGYVSITPRYNADGTLKTHNQ